MSCIVDSQRDKPLSLPRVSQPASGHAPARSARTWAACSAGDKNVVQWDGTESILFKPLISIDSVVGLAGNGTHRATNGR